MGLGAAGFTLTWACAKEVNRHALSGMATSLVNTGAFLGAAILQPLVGWAIDRAAGGGALALAHYQVGMSVLLGFALGGWLARLRPEGDELPLSVRSGLIGHHATQGQDTLPQAGKGRLHQGIRPLHPQVDLVAEALLGIDAGQAPDAHAGKFPFHCFHEGRQRALVEAGHQACPVQPPALAEQCW
jgi:hypothetical protein